MASYVPIRSAFPAPDRMCVQAPEVFNIKLSTQGANCTQINGPGPRFSHVSGCNRATEPAMSGSRGRFTASADGGQAYGDKADCWSSAVFIYEVLTGATPFAHIHNCQALERAVLFGPISPPAHLSPMACAFLTWALNRTPQMRPSIEQMTQHMWLHRGQPEPCPPPPPAAWASSGFSHLQPASAPHTMANPTASISAGMNAEDTVNAGERPARLTGCPSRRVIGFAPAVAAVDISTQSSSLQSTGEARTGEASQLGNMHRAVLEALRLHSPSALLSPRSQDPSQVIYKSASTRSCAYSSSSTALTSSGSALAVRAQSARLPCPAARPRPPPRVSSLTQALMLQKDISGSDAQSPLDGSDGPLHGVAMPSSFSPSPCHTGGRANGAAVAPLAFPRLQRRPIGVPCATVTVIYACDEPASPPMDECVLPYVEEAAPRDSTVDPCCGSEPVSNEKAREALALPRATPKALPPAPDSVMQQVAASVFTDCACKPSLASRSADALHMRDHGKSAKPQCPHREAVGDRCGNCQAAADLASIWQRAAERSPIQRQMHPVEGLLLRPPHVAGGHSPGAHADRSAGVGAGCTVSAPVNQVSEDAATAALPQRSEAVRPLLDMTAAAGEPGSEEERCYEVRGSWGGSIDSTAGAMFARLSRRLEVVKPAESASVGSMKGRVASWVANAAAALWEPVSDLSSDSNERSCNGGVSEVPMAQWGHSHMGVGTLGGAPARTSACGNSGDGMTTSINGGNRGEPLKVWETGTVSMSRELDAAASHAHSLVPPGSNQCAVAWQQVVAKGSSGGEMSSAEDNSFAHTAGSAAPGQSSGGYAAGSSRPCLESYGIDSSTVSLHALAAALTPSMTDPSLLRGSPVFPESRNV